MGTRGGAERVEREGPDMRNSEANSTATRRTNLTPRAGGRKEQGEEAECNKEPYGVTREMRAP